MPNKTKPTPSNYMNVPIQPATLPNWALTDEDVNQGLVKDIETNVAQLSDWDEMSWAEKFSARQAGKPSTVSQPIHPTEAMFIEQARFEEPADWTGRRMAGEASGGKFMGVATFTPAQISQKEKKLNIDNARRRARLMREEIRFENLRKKQALAEQQRLDSGMGWGSDLPPKYVPDSKIAREKAKAMIGEKLDAIPGFVWNLDLPTPATALGVPSLFASVTTQKKKFQDLLKW
jgi:hypothetical protein